MICKFTAKRSNCLQRHGGRVNIRNLQRDSYLDVRERLSWSCSCVATRSPKTIASPSNASSNCSEASGELSHSRRNSKQQNVRCIDVSKKVTSRTTVTLLAVRILWCPLCGCMAPDTVQLSFVYHDAEACMLQRFSAFSLHSHDGMRWHSSGMDCCNYCHMCCQKIVYMFHQNHMKHVQGMSPQSDRYSTSQNCCTTTPGHFREP